MLPVKIYLLSVTKSSILSPPGAKGEGFWRTTCPRPRVSTRRSPKKTRQFSPSLQGSGAMSPAKSNIAVRLGKLCPGAPTGRSICCSVERTPRQNLSCRKLKENPMPTFQRRWPTLACGLFAALLLCLTAAAQSITGNITGTVTDASGGVLVNATVTLVNEKTGEKRSINTNEDGRFNFAAVQPGVYTVRIEQAGFQILERRNTVLSANESLALGELALTVGQVTEMVTTVASGATVETESSDLTARLTSDQIALISTKGRDITSLLRLIPGTSNENDIEAVGEGFGTNLAVISGQRGRSAVATIDGLNASEPSGSNKLSMTINQDAVAEVKVLRNNYAAEYGNNGG